MIHESGFIIQKSKTDQRLYYNLYTPENKPVAATVLILHGMKEHSGRYNDIARFFCTKGFAILTYDHMGHGKSVKNGEALGHFQITDAAEQLIIDAEAMAEHLYDLFPGVSHFILGHSMGSFITRLLLQRSYTKFKGAVIAGTGGKNSVAAATKPFFALLNRTSPVRRSSFVNNTFDKMNNARFRNEPGGSSNSWLSLSKTNRQAFENDPLCGMPFSNRAFYTLISVNTLATKRNWADRISKQFPLLFVSGEEDPIGDFGKGILKTVSDLERDGFNDVSLLLYPGMRHEILNEEIKKDVYNDILEWFNEHLN